MGRFDDKPLREMQWPVKLRKDSRDQLIIRIPKEIAETMSLELLDVCQVSLRLLQKNPASEEQTQQQLLPKTKMRA